MELADVTDSKSVGSNTVRVRPPPSAPKSVTPLNEWGYTFYVLVGGRTRNLRVVHGCTMAVAQSRRKDAPTQTTAKARMPYKMNAQSFARCETNRAFINVQRMHDSGRTKSLHDAPTPTTAIRHLAKLPLPQTGIALLFWCRGANSHCAGRAWMHDSGRTESAQGRTDPNDRKRKDA